MDFTQIVQMLSQLGAVGLLAVIILNIPKLWKEWAKTREKDAERVAAEREADRQARKMTSDTYRAIVDKFMDRIGVEGEKNRAMFSAETRFERESCEKKFDALIDQAVRHQDALMNSLTALLSATNEQNKLLRAHHVVLQDNPGKKGREY